MQNETTEFSFLLKPSAIAGVGVFAVHDISKGTYLRFNPKGGETRVVKLSEIPKEFLSHVDVISKEEGRAPLDFGHMWLAWYVNHSKTPNAVFNFEEKNFYAAADIKAGEEITVDYNALGEPEEMKAEYYTK